MALIIGASLTMIVVSGIALVIIGALVMAGKIDLFDDERQAKGDKS